MTGLYVVKAIGLPRVKIGSTSRPVHDRISQLQTGCPVPLRLVAWTPIASDLDVHSLLRKLGVTTTLGEWYDDSEGAEWLRVLRAVSRLRKKGPSGDRSSGVRYVFKYGDWDYRPGLKWFSRFRNDLSKFVPKADDDDRRFGFDRESLVSDPLLALDFGTTPEGFAGRSVP